MRKIVVDASVVLKWYLPDESKDDKALNLLEGCVRGEIHLTAPTILAYEVINGLVIAARRGRLEAGTGVEAYRGFQELGIDAVDGAIDGVEILGTAVESGLTAYDAAYIALARREKAELATADKRLADAASMFGVKLLLI